MIWYTHVRGGVPTRLANTTTRVIKAPVNQIDEAPAGEILEAYQTRAGSSHRFTVEWEFPVPRESDLCT